MYIRLLTLPRIQLYGANAFSSPYTVGFPAMTAWLGGMHALQRKLQSQGYPDFLVRSVGVISHDFHLRVHTDSNGYTRSIIGERHPLKKDGKSPSFVEEPKCDLTVSLVVEYSGVPSKESEAFLALVEKTLWKMRLASGTVQALGQPELHHFDEDFEEEDEKKLRKCFNKLMPGYALIERHDLMTNAQREGKESMQALLDAITVEHYYEPAPEEAPPEKDPERKEDSSAKPVSAPKEGGWKVRRQQEGWVVPIAVGFHALSEPALALNQRDETTPHRFAESVLTLGEFVMINTFTELKDLLWSYSYQPEQNLYLCKQTK